MAETMEAVKKEETKAPAKKAVKKAPVQTGGYTVKELALVSEKLFGVKRECVLVALKGEKGVLSVEAAKDKVSKFMKKEVK